MEQQLDLVSFVKEPTWREILLESIEHNQMNPWEIDLVKVADAYLKQIRRMQAMDLRVPANVILASALLLHYKSESLKLEEEPLIEEETTFVPLIDEEIPQLVYNPNAARQRTITLEELISAVEEVMKDGKRMPLLPRVAAPPLDIKLPEETMNEIMERVYRISLALKDSENILLFSSLVTELNGNGTTKGETVSYGLLPLLHLVQERKLLAWQDSLFGEIFIKVF